MLNNICGKYTMASASCIFFSLVCTLSVVAIVIKLYVKLKTKWCTSKLCLVGKTIVVTGASTGIGYETALEFAKRGARVILADKDKAGAAAACEKIINETQNVNVVVKLVDFSSLKSVRNLAEDLHQTEEKIDILVNNAGILTADDIVTEDNLSLIAQVNYFGPFLLTILLLDMLKKSAPSRIVNVSSIVAALANLDVDQPNAYRGPFDSYSNSKLCNMLFTMHLAKILEKHITAYSVHPGAVNSKIFRTIKERWVRCIISCVKDFFFKSSEEGAQTTIHVAIQQGIECFSGRHFEECEVVKTYSTASHPELPKRLWDSTVKLLDCHAETQNL